MGLAFVILAIALGFTALPGGLAGYNRHWLVWAIAAIAVLAAGWLLGVHMADSANPSYNPWNEDRIQYDLERFFAACIPLLPATALALSFGATAILGSAPEDSRRGRFLHSKRLTAALFVLSLLIGLYGAASAAAWNAEA